MWNALGTVHLKRTSIKQRAAGCDECGVLFVFFFSHSTVFSLEPKCVCIQVPGRVRQCVYIHKDYSKDSSWFGVWNDCFQCVKEGGAEQIRKKKIQNVKNKCKYIFI